MLQALADAVRDQVLAKFELKTRLEGATQHGWLVADYRDVIVHLFSPDQRAYYQLENLWSEGKILLRLQ